MDILKATLICRLCGTELIKGNYKSIFHEDLINKIRETLPISISVDDGGSKYVCFLCSNRIILHYKFIQEVVEQSKKLENALQMNPFSTCNEISDFSQIGGDAVHTCPNCNIDLMILVSKPQGCDSFQISLAMINCPEKKNIQRAKDMQIHKDVESFSEVKNNVHIKCEDRIDVKDTEKGHDRINFMLPVMKQEENSKCSNLCDPTIHLSKVLILEKLQIIPNEKLFDCNYDSKEPLLIKNETESNDNNWLNSEAHCKSENDTCGTESQYVMLEDVDAQDENDANKPYLKYVCNLCGARYLSHIKYEFHKERHKLGKIHKYECTLCDKEARSENLLWDHYFHMHKSSQRFICTECGKIFMKRSRLNVHQKTFKHSGIKQIKINSISESETNEDIVQTPTTKQISVNCNLCGKLISDLDPDALNDLVTCTTCEDSTLSLMIDGNETKVISPRQYHCSMCPKHFVRKERLEFHEMRHNENMNEFICSTCGKDFKAENSLYEHYLFVHKGARPHICELCGKSFQLKARLKEHHRIHTGERPYQCDICGQQCRTTNALKLHRKIHFSHNKYTCNICNKSFTKKQNMNEHLEKHWKNDKSVRLPQLFTCPICAEDFPTYRMLKSHMIKIHEIDNQDPILTEQKPWYECSECHEKFKHQMSLKAHKERIHEGKVDPVYQCDICNATYRVKQLLVNHIKSKHNGEKRYKCAQCEKGFNDTKSLYNHVLLHTGKKPFVCEYCNMSFRRKDSRDHHRRKHTGEQPYQCPDCDESFATYNHRSKHRKREHGERDPECPECREKCSNQQEIRIHLNKHLGEKLKRIQNVEFNDT